MSEDVEESTKTDLIETELKAYDRLKPLQGLVALRCFGEACYDGARALVLEDLGGHSLASPVGALLPLEQLSAMLQECYRALHAYGVHQDDAQVGNFQLVNGKLMALDLEMVEFDVPVGDLQRAMESCIAHLVNGYRRVRRNYRKFDHLLEAA